MLDNCSVLDPWLYCSESAWFSEAFARENQAVTRALQISLSDNSSSDAASPSAATSSSSPFLLHHRQHSHTAHTPAAYPLRSLGPAPSGRVSKRRSRAPKHMPTTYINADPTNFREMVQRVTGVQVDCGILAAEPMVKPEPVLPAVADCAALRQVCLSTLDTSALLLDCFAVPPDDDRISVDLPDHIPDFNLDGLLPGFPTLESWDAM